MTPLPDSKSIALQWRPNDSYDSWERQLNTTMVPNATSGEEIS